MKKWEEVRSALMRSFRLPYLYTGYTSSHIEVLTGGVQEQETCSFRVNTGIAIAKYNKNTFLNVGNVIEAQNVEV